MFESQAARVAYSLFKVAMFLACGTMIGFLLGLAYASHLYGTPPVVVQIQNWLMGDVLYEKPLPVDQAGNLMNTPVSLIPRIGACVGFGIAASVLSGSIFLRAVVSAVKPGQKSYRSNDQNDADQDGE